MKFPLKTIIGIAGITVAIAWSVQGVDFNDVGRILADMNRSLTIGVLILTTSNLVIRAYVWKFIINPIKRVPLRHALSTYLIGVFSNLFLPFKLGDVAQGYSLGRKQEMSKISSVSAVLIQRIFEVTSLLLIMVAVAAMFSFPLLLQRRTLALGLLILLGITVLFIAYRKREYLTMRIEAALEKISPDLAQLVGKSLGKFLEGTTAIHNPADIVKIMIFSLLSWVVQIVMVRLTAGALDISIDIVASSVVLLIINLGLVIPLAPGNIGTFQFFSIIALSLFSVTKPRALTFAIIFQVIQGVPVIIGGGFFVLQEVLSSKRRIPSARTEKKNMISSGNT